MKFALKGAVAAICLGTCSLMASAAVLNISTLSTHPDRVSGGDVLVQVTTDAGGAGTIVLNRSNINKTFRAGTAPNTLVALITGLNLGQNTLVAGGVSLVITNYPIKGPIIS